MSGGEAECFIAIVITAFVILCLMIHTMCNVTDVANPGDFAFIGKAFAVVGVCGVGVGGLIYKGCNKDDTAGKVTCSYFMLLFFFVLLTGLGALFGAPKLAITSGVLFFITATIGPLAFWGGYTLYDNMHKCGPDKPEIKEDSPDMPAPTTDSSYGLGSSTSTANYQVDDVDEQPRGIPAADEPKSISADEPKSIYILGTKFRYRQRLLASPRRYSVSPHLLDLMTQCSAAMAAKPVDGSDKYP